MMLLNFEYERKLVSCLKQKFKLRQSSYPLLSGDTFRKIADLLYDSTKSCQASEFFDGCIVFVKTDRLWDFINYVIPFVSNRFKLITHQGDLNITDEYACLANNNLLIHWFAQNCSYNHEKITPLPIGLEDRWWHNNGVLWEFKKYFKKNTPAYFKIVSAFDTSTNIDIRTKWKNVLNENSIVVTPTEKMNSREYRHWVKNYFFIASPPGNGLDCHRTWEAMYMNMIPIVKRDIMTEYFISQKLPIYAIESETELASLTAKKLQDIKLQIDTMASKEALYADYWIKEIANKK